MSTFQGFKVTGIDPNQYPVFTDDNDMRHDLFYLTLKPIDADADDESQKLWDYCFRRGVEIWGAGLPELQFIFDADCSVCISASGEPLRTLESQLFEIERLVENVNEMFIKAAKDVIYFRKTIKEINDSFSRRVIKV